MIANPSACGTGLTGWSTHLKDTEVTDLAIMKPSRADRFPRWGGQPPVWYPAGFVTRSFTMKGRGAFDPRPAHGRFRTKPGPAESAPRLNTASTARPASLSVGIGPRVRSASTSSMRLLVTGYARSWDRLARTTMVTMPRSHRDRLSRATRFGWRSGSSSGKGVRAA